MKKVYKLTTQDNTTHNGCKWVPGEWKETNGEGPLCGPGWLHAYEDKLTAVFMNPEHAKIANPKLWIAEADGKFLDSIRRLRAGVAGKNSGVHSAAVFHGVFDLRICAAAHLARHAPGN